MLRGAGTSTEILADIVSLHHNWLDCTSGKHCFDLPDDRLQCWFFNNVCIQGLAGVFTNLDKTVNSGIAIINNLIFGWRQYAPLYVDGAGSVLWENNVVLQVVGNTPSFGTDWFLLEGTGTVSLSQDNVFFDPTGLFTGRPSGDTTSATTNPDLVSVGTQNFVPGAGSPAVNLGTTPAASGLVTLDFNFLVRPQGSNSKIAAGPYERPGG
jgi:hypothetical protein